MFRHFLVNGIKPVVFILTSVIVFVGQFIEAQFVSMPTILFPRG